MGFQFKFFNPVVELRLENDPWIVKMEYYRNPVNIIRTFFHAFFTVRKGSVLYIPMGFGQIFSLGEARHILLQYYLCCSHTRPIPRYTS